jgi:putative BNR repeat neuraminidase
MRHNIGVLRRQLLLAGLALPARSEPLPRDTGYRGIWYFNQPSGDQYVYKYSGGFATYPQQHAPIAIYSPAARKTFFVYGGSANNLAAKPQLLHMVSYYDHATGTVPRPVILLNKETEDAHDNPVLSIDDDGYLWIFSPAHGTSRPSFLHRGRRPYSIDDFELITKTNWSYPQPWYVPGRGFFFLHTRYQPIPGKNTSGRALHWMTSRDGRKWSDPNLLAFAQLGHYQISWPHRNKIATAFDLHPSPVGLNARTNIYYLETSDMGQTWNTVEGTPVRPPIRWDEHPSLVRDFRKDGLLVYLKDIQFDPVGRPIIAFLASRGYQSGPASGSRTLWTARWDGGTWLYSRITTTDHNYDHGSLYILSGQRYRYLAPTGPGPQPHSAGGEVETWETYSGGAEWQLTIQHTRNSRYNHTYVRRPLNYHPDFCSLWADGNPLSPSPSRIYFSNTRGEVYLLPDAMTTDQAKPILIKPQP